jgi:hypothetical protein
MTLTAGVLTLVLGGVGGMLNAMLTDRRRWLPFATVPGSHGKRLVELGLIGHVFVGAMAAAGVRWAMAGTPILSGEESGWLIWLPAGAGLFVAFVTSRWITNEVDKAIFRRTICKAAMAPAAHPDTVRTLEQAPPTAVYAIIDDLLPRRAIHR